MYLVIELETDLKWLQAKCNRLTQQSPPKRENSPSEKERRSKEKRNMKLKGQIEKENIKILQLKKEEKKLLK